MAGRYRDFGDDAAFHYVSGGPWQLYESLHAFVTGSGGFPDGSFHMKNVRTNLLESETYHDLWKLAGGSGAATFEQKVAQISTLLRRFPRRHFVLVGDSGELDPEVFATVRKQFPEQVVEVVIRDVLPDDESNPRRYSAMTLLPPGDDQCSEN